MGEACRIWVGALVEVEEAPGVAMAGKRLTDNEAMIISSASKPNHNTSKVLPLACMGSFYSIEPAYPGEAFLAGIKECGPLHSGRTLISNLSPGTPGGIVPSRIRLPAHQGAAPAPEIRRRHRNRWTGQSLWQA